MYFGFVFRLKLILTGILFVSGFVAFAQKQITHQPLIWYAYLQNLKISDRITLQTDIQERHFIKPLRQSQFVIRPTLKINIKNNWDIGVGACYFITNTDPTADFELNLGEFRPHIEANQRQAFKIITTSHRFRLESRFFQNMDGISAARGLNFNSMRFRYQFGIDILLNKPKAEKHTLKLRILDEFMLNFGKKITNNIFDQNRINVILHYAPIKAIAFEAGYINWFQQRPSGNNFFNRNIFRIGIINNLHIHKKEKITDGNI